MHPAGNPLFSLETPLALALALVLALVLVLVPEPLIEAVLAALSEGGQVTPLRKTSISHACTGVSCHACGAARCLHTHPHVWTTAWGLWLLLQEYPCRRTGPKRELHQGVLCLIVDRAPSNVRVERFEVTWRCCA